MIAHSRPKAVTLAASGLPCVCSMIVGMRLGDIDIHMNGIMALLKTIDDQLQ